jgi:hypothetical protein
MGTELTSGGIGGSGLQRVPARRLASDEPTGSIALGQLALTVDLQVVTMDAKGRVPLRRAAGTMGWIPGSHVALSLHDSVLRLSHDVSRGTGIDLTLDRRLRVQLPFGVRVTTAFRPGTRLIVLAVHDDGVVAAAPLSGVIDRLLGGL